MNLDIRTGVQTAFVLALIGVIIGLYLGIRRIREGQQLLFFQKRRKLILSGWRMILVGIIFGTSAYLLYRHAEPVAYQFFPPSPTVTLTPTITTTPTTTLSSTITLSPTVTHTPQFSPTPEIPSPIAVKFSGLITPNPNAVFSPIQFSRTIDDNNFPINPVVEFNNPIIQVIGSFSYNNMLDGAQWTAIWYRLSDDFMICHETKPWDGGTGGYGYTDCQPDSDEWLSGEYEVQIFIGEQWKSSNRFTVAGDPVKPSNTPSATPTISSTPTSTSTFTSTPSRTPTYTRTPSKTFTPRPTNTKTRTPPPTSTMRPSNTPRVTDTKWPTTVN